MRRSSDVVVDGRRLRRLRTEKLLTQVELGALAGMSDRRISAIEVAGEARVYVSTARDLAAALDVDVGALRPIGAANGATVGA